ncbi:MAG: BlaI/MecI/CopY family transcriptional regulator [Armatimonadetes bacterium]|nr:BlaI/MecI/CopY family transcriptional regulator [Armatimonadota bacterium]
MNKQPDLGDQELEVLRYVADHAPITVRAAAEQWGEPRGLARTTILTVMERLRKKGYLARHKAGGAFAYTPVIAKTDVLRGLVQNFVEKTLAGSLSPFVAYLADNKDLSPSELEALKRLVREMDSERR